MRPMKDERAGVVERIRTYGLVRTKFWENHSRNAIGDDRFYWDMLISPEKVLKSGQSLKTFHHHCIKPEYISY